MVAHTHEVWEPTTCTNLVKDGAV